MAYLTLTDGGQQIFGYDSNQTSNVTINTTPAAIKTTVQTLQAGLTLAQNMAKAFGVDTTATDTDTSSSSSSSGSSTVSGASG